MTLVLLSVVAGWRRDISAVGKARHCRLSITAARYTEEEREERKPKIDVTEARSGGGRLQMQVHACMCECQSPTILRRRKTVQCCYRYTEEPAGPSQQGYALVTKQSTQSQACVDVHHVATNTLACANQNLLFLDYKRSRSPQLTIKNKMFSRSHERNGTAYVKQKCPACIHLT